MRNAAKSLRPSLVLLQAAVLMLALGMPGPAGAAFSSKTIAKCQASVHKATEKLLGSKLRASLDCAERLLACQLAEELDGETYSQCAAKATTVCTKKLSKIAARQAAVASVLSGKCADLAALDLVSRRGLGYGDIGDACAALTPAATSTDASSIADCLSRAMVCRGDDVVEALLPRAYEVLDRGGVLATSPTLFPCLDVRSPSPASSGSAKGLIGCQRVIEKNNQKKLKVQQKGVHACADLLLSCQLKVDRLETAYVDAPLCAASVAAKCDAKLGKIDGAVAKRDAKIVDKCGAVAVGDALAGLGFAATCATATTISDVGACADVASDTAVERAMGMAEPRTCRLYTDSSRIGEFSEVCIPFCGNAVVEAGEICDDGNVDDVDSCTTSCSTGPTAVVEVTIASPAAPANTPDGTPANAVAPASTLAVQFGSTTFDLNNSTYWRFHAPGAGDPDAVLVLIPGFVGGANSFKHLAENLIVRAQAAGAMVLEVWAYDRRTNQLEDDAGAVLAEAERDPLLALDWYFGGELGFSLDPRLSRRAVFHSGQDLAFLANWTYNMFAHDIDAIVDTALALPSAPAVFLGGHSLGTTFAARYAATDFDTGAGVAAGYSKLSGLVLFEGGGDSVATTPPSDDDLDLIIARADGGLFAAVANKDARCVDGTPCPGGDTDCAGVALPSGALTNKCVQPVEAYTGEDLSAAFVLVTPQVHAVGDVAAIQGILDPDGLSLLQTDFGSGAPVDIVTGLGALSVLPPSTTGAAIGFFLDDDFSPVTAFQVSIGFSDNGLNADFFGITVPFAAQAPDPFRIWKDINDPLLPAAALPDNGFAFSPSDVNGPEKEVTRIGIATTLLRSDGNNFGDSYFAASGLGTTAAASADVFSGGLDSTALSVGRGRADIENLTEAAAINVPVICFGGRNGLTPTPGSFRSFADSIGTCSAPSCSGAPRVVDGTSAINPVYGDVAGGFEVHMNAGYAHIDIVSADDNPAHNNVYDPLMAFLTRNAP